MTALTTLHLQSNQLSSLPADLFDGLTALTTLHLQSNQLSSLPADLFDGLTALTTLHLQSNQLSSLPADLFDGLTALTTLHLQSNAVNPLPLTVSLEKVGEGQFKAVAPTGAPFELVLPVSVSGPGAIEGGATTITIPIGSLESTPLTVPRTPGTTAAVTVDIGNLPSLPPVEHEGYSLVKSEDLPLLVWEDITGICDRTPQVRDAIVAAVSNVSTCGDVRGGHLAAIYSLNLPDKSITSLKADDFDGLTRLTWLYLRSNQLSSLPAGIFDNLTALRTLDLFSNQLSSLPAGIFDNLTALTQLYLHNNQLTALPAGLFDTLTNLTDLYLSSNQLSSLPAGLFDNLNALTRLNLFGNQLSSLPEGIFDGLTALTSLGLQSNSVRPLPLTVSLEKVGEGQFKAVAPTGAPFDIVLPFNVMNGTINGGASSVTIPKGSLESQPLTATRTPGTTAAVTVDIGTLPGLPTNHSGYALVKSADLPLEIWARESTLVCDRTPQVRDAIVAAVPNVSTCGDVTGAHLAAITELELEGQSIPALQVGDFDGLTALTSLDLDNNQLASLPVGIFDTLTNLIHLYLTDNQLTALPVGAFDNLGVLETLYLTNNQLTALPVGIDNLTTLTRLALNSNQLTALPEGVFDKLTALTTLNLDNNQLTALPVGIFDTLTNLTQLYLDNNQLTSLPEGIFGNLNALTTLHLDGNQLTALPEGIFDGIALLTTLTLYNGPVDPLPLMVSLEKVGEDQVKAVAPSGVPFDMVLPLSVASGSISGGATTITIPVGSVESQPLTVMRTPSTTAAVTVDIGTLPGLPPNHQGYALVKSTDLPLEMFSLLAGGTTYNVGDAIPLPTGFQTARLTIGSGRAVTAANGTYTCVAAVNCIIANGAVTQGTIEVTTSAVASNNAPEFTDGASTTLSVAENTVAGVNLGVAIAATDADNEVLTYTLGGIDAAAFAIDSTTGQLQTSAALDYETTSSYSVVVTVSDGSLTDTITVTINVTDLDESLIPVCDRTPQVRDAIVAVVPGVSNCRNVTEAHLAAITLLDLRSRNITTLKAGDFDGLSSLRSLRLGNNQLSSLSADLFSGLTALGWLDMRRNQLTTLPDKVFSGLTALGSLNLGDNNLSSLPAGVFSDLTALWELHVYGNNNLSSLPAGVFSGLTALRTINLGVNKLTSLPPGVFSGLSSLGRLWLGSREPPFIPVTVSLEKVGEDQFKATVHTGAPFEIVLPLSVANGSISSGTSTITIPIGSVESETLTVARTPGTTFAVTVDIGTLPELPEGEHLGYTLVKSADLPLEMFSRLAGGITPVCDRTPQVQTAILGVLQLQNPSPSICEEVTEAHLATGVTSLFLNGQGITALKAGDFDGLISLEELLLYSNQLTTLPEGIFDGLSSLTTLRFGLNQLTTLPEGIFEELTALTDLRMIGNQFTMLPEGIFEGLTALTTLRLGGNAVDPLPLTISLETVGEGQFKAVAPTGAPFDIVLPLTVANGSISGGATTITIPTGRVDSESLTVTRTPGSTFAVTVDIGNLPGLPANHSGYTLVKSADLPLVLTELGGDIITPVCERTRWVRDAIVAAVPDVSTCGNVTEAQIAAIESLTLDTNGALYLRAGDFSGLSSLMTLEFRNNGVLTLPEGVFTGLSSLTTLRLFNNGVLTLPEGVFTGLPSLTTLEMRRRTLTVTLTKVGEGQFKAVAPTGAPFDIVLPLSVTNGTIDGGATTITISKGSVGSAPLTVTRTPGTTFAVTVDIGTLPGLPEGHSGYALVKSADLPLVFTELGGAVFTPVSERTPQVRDAIVAAVPGVNSADDVTEAHLAAITTFNLGGRSITALKAGDFDGLNALTSLSLWSNQLSSLPEGIFDNLNALTSLNLEGNQLSSLPEGIFDNLNALTSLFLGLNQLGSLPAGIFDNLNALTWLGLDGNQLSSLPAGIFDNLNALTSLFLGLNQLGSLPEGIFDGLSSLTMLYLYQNAVDPLPLTVSLEKVGADQVKAVAPSGAPFDMVLPIIVANGSISGGATTLTIPAGSLESAPLTVTRTSGTTAAVTVDIGTLPGLPTNHSGYALVKSADLPLEIFSLLAGGICDRTPQVQTAILGALQSQTPSPSTCGEVTEAHLATGITSLFLNGQSLTALQADDFAGLTSLTELRLYDNQLTTLPADLFDGLTALTTLYLNGNQLSTLPEGLFDGLSSLATLYLYGNSVDPLPLTVSLEKVGTDQVKAVAPAGAPFDLVLPLTVTNGSISGGATSITIPAGSLESQPLTVTRTPSTTAAVTMDIGTLPRPPTNHSGYTLVKSTDLPLEIISATTPNTAAVNIPDANLRTKVETALGKTPGDPISAAEMATLTSLAAQDASISDLTGLETATNLTELQLWDNNIADMAAVAGLTNLTKLYLWGNAITDISHVAALTNLTHLRLGENSIANVSAVAGLTNLTHLYLRENSVSDIAAVAGLTNLTELRIGDNTISSIAAVANLTNLVWLDAPNNSISDMAAVTNLTSLTSLTMSGNSITDLSAVAGLTDLLELYLAENAVSDLSPLVSNTGLGENTEIDVLGNPLSYPSIYTHIPALQARSVFIEFDNRTPTTLAKVSGDSQQGDPETALAQPFVVEVQDGNSVAFAGVPVTFAVTAGGGTLSATSTTTDANGRAASTLTLGNSAGTNTVQVSVQGISQTATFTAEATTTDTAVDEGTNVITYNVGDTIPLPTGFQTPRLTIGSGRTITAANGTYTCVGAVNCIIANGAVTQGTIEVTTGEASSSRDETPVVSALTPVCDRTPQVRDAIVAAVPSVSDCNNVTEAHLAAITGTLSLLGESITALAAGDFAGLTALENLNLRLNRLTTLPAGVFDELTALTALDLQSNDLTTLPAGVFDGLTALTGLDLQSNALTTLPAGVFDGLTALTELWLPSNDLTTLPAGVFDGLTALELLLLGSNDLTTLPAGVFDGLTALTGLDLSDNPGAPFAPKAVALPDDGTIPVAGGTVTLDGSGSGGPWGTNVTYGWALTSPASGVTVTFDDDTSATPVVTIPALTEGTELTFTLTVTAVPSGATGTAPAPDTATVTATASTSTAGICGRTTEVQTAILAGLQQQNPSPSTCGEVTEAHLAAITSLSLSGRSITALKAGDFAGLTALTVLDLWDNELSSLPAGIFDNLTALTTLYLQNNQLSSLPVGIGRLTALTTLDLSHNELSSLPAGIFGNLTALTDLRLLENQLSSLPTGIGELTALTYLQLGGNNFTTLPTGIFDKLSNLRQLYLGSTELSSLPAGIFDNLTALTTLLLVGTELSSLPTGIFDNLTALEELTLANNQFTTLPAGIFDNLTALTTLNLSFNQLTTLPAGIFDNLTALLTLRLHRNSVDPLPLTVSLEKVGADQVKAVAPSGAPFNLVLPLTVTNGSISGGATTITISKGNVESTSLTVTRTSGTTAAVTVDIGTLPGLPSNHQGYALVKSADLPLEIISATTPNTATVNIPDANLRANIETALGKTSGDPISPAEMATLIALSAQDASISDLTGLETATNLTELQLWDNAISNISAVAGLTKLTKLYLWGNAIADLSHVAGLTNLTDLRLGENSIANVSAVAALTNLTHLGLRENSVSDIAAVAGLTNLTELRIGDNTISSIAAVANLTNLVWLDAPNNSISDLAAVANLTNLTSLTMSGNSITDLSAVAGLTDLLELFLAENAVSDLSPLVSNTGLGENTEIDVQGNPLSYSSIYTHIPALQARSIYIDFDNRTPTTLVKVSGDSQQGDPETALANPFVVEVQDANSVAFAGVPVAFAVTGGGGTLSATNTTTDANGQAASTLTLGTSAGTNTVQVSVQGIAQTETFTAEATTTDTAVDEGTEVTTYNVGDTIPLPTGFQTARLTIGSGRAVTADNGTYTCVAAVDCIIANGAVTQGTIEVTTSAVASNNAPEFTDGVSTTLSVAENTVAGVNLGAAIAATDADNEVLTYTLGGTDAAAFAIESATGQLQTSAALDYETKSSYSVVVTVSDDSLTDTINVTINVTDLDESLIPVCDRTPQVRDAIVAVVPGVSTCGEVTKAHLTSDITSLFLNGQSITTLQAGDFEDLTSLTELRLYGNQLTTLPAGLFDGLSALTTLYLNGNQLSTLPDGLFDGLAALTTLYLYGNAVDPLPLTVSLEKVGADQVKAVAPSGAPFDLVLPLAVANGSTSGGATTLTIPAGSVESQPLTVTRTSGTTAAVTMDIGTLPRPPTNHSGYTLGKSTDLPLEVIGEVAVTVTIPDANLRAQIETALGKTSGDPISPAEMATLTALSAQDASISDLTGLETATNLTELQLWDNNISDIAAVAGLTKLTKLYLWGNTITDIAAVAALTNLTDLRLGENSIANVSAVAGLTDLTHLDLRENAVSDISAVAGLTNLTELRIGDNTISNIAAVADLTNLVWLDAPNNSISDIAAVADLTNLTSLTMSGNSITDLSAVAGLTNLLELYLAENAVADLSPLVSNTGLGADTEIDVQGNPLDYPSIYTHIPALQARSVFIDFDNRTPTTLAKVSGDTQQGTSGTALAQPFVVEVQDANSVAFAGVPVAFAVSGGGGTLSATSTTTDANGQAESTLTLGSSAGTNTVRASAQGISQTAIFTAEATTTNTEPVSALIPVCDRTLQVRDAIVATVPSVSDCNDVTEAHLAAITSLNIDNKSIESLKAGDFDGLSALTTLYLSNNQLTSLPEGVFSGLSALTTLNLTRNQLSSLPAGIFDNLNALTELHLGRNQLSSLPAGIFDNLNALTTLNLSGNQFTTLPAGIFDNLNALTRLYLATNQLSSLPAGIFDNLNALTGLDLGINSVNPLPLTVSLEKVGEGQFKATAPAGAPFDIALPLTVVDGTITGGANSVTIRAGRVESEPLTVTRTPGTTSTVTVDIGILPGLPANHIGYALVKSPDLPLEVISAPTDGTACRAGDVLAPGESCTYPGTEATFSVLDDGKAQLDIPGAPAWFNNISIGGSLRISATINDERYLFIAEALASGSWEIKEVGDSGDQQPEQPEEPGNEEGTPTLSISTASSLTEATLHESVVTLSLSGGTYERSIFDIRDAVTVSGIPGVTVGTFGVRRVSDTEVTVELEFDGTDFDTDATLTYSVGADAIANYNGPLLTAQIPVTANTEVADDTGVTTPVPEDSGDQAPDPPEQPDEPIGEGGTPILSISTASPLTEATLHESVVTLTLSGGVYDNNWNYVSRSVTVSGIAGVTFRRHNVDRVSDTVGTVELEFEGDIDSDATLTFTVGADAIANYNGLPFTVQIPVTANTESVVASTTSPLTEATLHESVVTLTLSGRAYHINWNYVSRSVTVSGIAGVTFRGHNVDRVSDTQVTVELDFNGNIDTDATLTFTVGADAIANYNGPPLTAQIPVTANTESVVASTASPLTEATLHESVVTLTLSGGAYERSIFKIRGAVEVSGIAGVTVGTFGIDRISDTEITVELEFNGTDFDTDATLTFTVGADAIANYNGPALTTQIPVTAIRENALVANFPNPFNPETWISYQLAAPAEVALTIYALNGQVVRRLALGHQSAGTYAAYWDGRSEFGKPVASGVYFYRLTAGNFTATRKMLIQK